MNEERTPLHESQDSATHSQETPVGDFHESSSSGRGLKIGVILLALAAGFAGTYAWVQQRAVRDLVSNRDQLSASLQQMHSEEAALNAKINALSAAQTAASAPPETGEVKNSQFAPRTGETPRSSTRHVVAHRRPADDPRWKQIQEQLGKQEKELDEDKQKIAETQTNLDQAKSELQSNLESARSELGGDIARNHGELVALQKKGERNYYEFDIPKSKTYHHTGPISIAVRKVNDKQEYCDLDMVINDSTLSRKHVNLYESVAFYPEGYPLPLEVVINRIAKDSIHGYVSEPKYRTNTAQAVSPVPTPTTASVSPAAAATPDPTLQHRPDDAH